VGGNLEQLVNRPDERYCFRYMDQRVYYVSERLMKTATNFGRDNLLSLGTCVGRFTKVREGIEEVFGLSLFIACPLLDGGPSSFKRRRMSDKKE